MLNFLKIKKEKQKISTLYNDNSGFFENESLRIKLKEYYFSNVIARSSKTMLDCNNEKKNFKQTGTEG